MAIQQTVDQVRQLCAAITQTPVDSLLTNPNWGSINFESGRKNFEAIFGIINQIKNLPIEMLPDDQLNPLRDAIGQAAVEFDKIRQFSIAQANPVGIRDQLLNSIQGQANNLYSNAQARLPFLALQRGDVRQNEEALADAVSRANSLLSDATQFSSLKKEEVNGIITAAREASASVGVATFTSDFDGTASTLEGVSTVWLKWTAGLAVATVGVAFAYPYLLPIDGEGFTANTVQRFTSKVVILAALFTATIWCGRMYKASKHQAAVNRHRANALKTFQAFVKASSDNPTRDAVLMETTRSIFALGNTGYLDGEEGGNENSLKILEVVKTAAEAAKG